MKNNFKALKILQQQSNNSKLHFYQKQKLFGKAIKRLFRDLDLKVINSLSLDSFRNMVLESSSNKQQKYLIVQAIDQMVSQNVLSNQLGYLEIYQINRLTMKYYIRYMKSYQLISLLLKRVSRMRDSEVQYINKIRQQQQSNTIEHSISILQVRKSTHFRFSEISCQLCPIHYSLKSSIKSN